MHVCIIRDVIDLHLSGTTNFFLRLGSAFPHLLCKIVLGMRPWVEWQS